MLDLALNNQIINCIKEEVTCQIVELMKSDLVEIILYGSCARGDFHSDSDIDIAIITKCNRMDSKKYNKELARIATSFAMQYFAVVNFVCLPYEEYIEKKDWYPYFSNIEREGQVLYG